MGKILVTGASGLVGSAIASQLKAQGNDVTGLSRKAQNGHLGIKWEQCDLNDELELGEILSQYDLIYHCGALVSFTGKNQQEMYRINVEGTANLVNFCLIHQVKLCFISSVAALGRSITSTIIDEDVKWEESPFNTAYAKSKYLSELEVWRGIYEGLDAVIVNPSVILGIGDWTTTSLQLYQYVYQQKSFYTLGYVNYVDVRDVADFSIRLAEEGHWGERFILCGGHVTYQQLFEAMAKEMGVRAPYRELKPWMGELGWRATRLLAIIPGFPKLMSRETVRASRSRFTYNTRKVTKALASQFTPLQETLAWSCKANILLNTAQNQQYTLL